MENYVPGELENCLVCGEFMGELKNELTITTAFSDATILDIIGNNFSKK